MGEETGNPQRPLSAVESGGPALGDDRAAPRAPLAAVDAHCVSLKSPESYEAGHYLRLRSTLERLRGTEGGLVVAVTSPAAGDGKSLTSVNLAGALARMRGARVLLADVDLRRHSEALNRYFGFSNRSGMGLTDMLLRPALRFEACVRRFEQLGLDVLLSGTASLAPFEALASNRFGELMMRARSRYDYVVVDAPPVVPVPDCRVVSKWVDGFVMVVAANRTPRPMLAEALRAVDPEKLYGLVLNECDQLMPRYYRYYGHYGYASRASAGEERRTLEAVPGAARGGAGRRERREV